MSRSRPHVARRVGLVLLAFAAVTGAGSPAAALDCPAEQPRPLLPTDPALCARLAPLVRAPGSPGLRDDLAEYEELLGRYLRAFCHRDATSGWKRDKRVRDTGPFTAALQDGAWTGTYRGTHAPVVVWYSPEMIAWLEANRPAEGGDTAARGAAAPVPDGAMMVKEMFPAPAASCAGVDPLRLLPTSGAAVMVRARGASQDGWFWGWFGWSGWSPDWPPDPANRYPYMGFGQYCVNCHASARDEHTFASLANVEGYAGEPLVFLSQHFFTPEPVASHHRLVALPTDDAPRLGQPHVGYSRAFVDALPAHGLPRPSWESVVALPSQTYDEVWVEAGPVSARSQLVTSSQCIGCHDAGGTGLQFDMTVANPHGANLLNLSPYATWRTSPMGLGGRDPVFFAQLASERALHPSREVELQGICLGCHGVAGQRQFEIDRFAATGECEAFPREAVDAVPWPAGNAGAPLARYGALARDGITCAACHHMLPGVGEGPALARPENACVAERQRLLNPAERGFARTFTGSFLLGPPDELYGPFADPKRKPMESALGIRPVHAAAIQSSELCGSCHTVHLPVLSRTGRIVAHTYEQATYPEWAFSAYRTGETPQGKLPGGAGAKAQSCQQCHMPSRDESGRPARSKIAGIQERSSFPQAENARSAEEIDLPVREGFARHTLVGLNVFLVKMFQQFPDVLGIRTQDPMLVARGLDPLLYTEQAMLDQASGATATVAVSELERRGGRLSARVTVTSAVGHKLPSGVGFRRAFLAFTVTDALGNVLWASGRTNGAGVIVDERGAPLAGELWWRDDCSARLHPDRLEYQPHHETIRRQDQAQIYQELVSAPPAGDSPRCGLDAPPRAPLTTSFLSICGRVKDNRILPDGFLPLGLRERIARALGAGEDLARDVEPFGIGDDPDYRDGGGADSLRYEIDLAEVDGEPAAVQATLYYQATPPYYLQDRFCTSRSEDTQRLYFLSGHLNLEGTAAAGWKLEVAGSGSVPVPPEPAQPGGGTGT